MNDQIASKPELPNDRPYTKVDYEIRSVGGGHLYFTVPNGCCSHLHDEEEAISVVQKYPDIKLYRRTITTLYEDITPLAVETIDQKAAGVITNLEAAI